MRPLVPPSSSTDTPPLPVLLKVLAVEAIVSVGTLAWKLAGRVRGKAW